MSIILDKNGLGNTLKDLKAIDNKINIKKIQSCHSTLQRFTYALKILKSNGEYMKYLPDDIRQSKIHAITAIENCSYAIEYVHNALYDDHGFMGHIILLDGLFLEYASPKLKNNKFIVMNAINENIYSILYSSIILKNNSDVIKFVLNVQPTLFNMLPHTVKQNKEFVTLAIRKYTKNISFVGDKIFNKTNANFILELLKIDHNIFKYIGHYKWDALNDYDFMLRVTNGQLHLLKYASIALLNNRDFISQVVQNYITHTKNMIETNPENYGYHNYKRQTKKFILQNTFINKVFLKEYQIIGHIMTFDEYNTYNFSMVLNAIVNISTIKKKYNCDMVNNSNNDCSICYDKITYMDNCWLACHHYFHLDCVMKWLKNTKTCPICRTQIKNTDIQSIKDYCCDKHCICITKLQKENEIMPNGIAQNYDSDIISVNSINDVSDSDTSTIMILDETSHEVTTNNIMSQAYNANSNNILINNIINDSTDSNDSSCNSTEPDDSDDSDDVEEWTDMDESTNNESE